MFVETAASIRNGVFAAVNARIERYASVRKMLTSDSDIFFLR